LEEREPLIRVCGDAAEKYEERTKEVEDLESRMWRSRSRSIH
jgi:hypothetical protein